MPQSVSSDSSGRVSTGVAGLDEVLAGGLPAHRLYLLQGNPGSGKTTLALQFLLEGRRRGERGLYITLSETRDELLQVAESHGWSLEGIEVYDLGAAQHKLQAEQQNTFFHPSEVELTETTDALLREVQRIEPSRVIFDSVSELRLLAQEPLRYRRQVLAFKQFFNGRDSTVLFLDDRATGEADLQLQSIAHGVVRLEQLSPLYGASRRRLSVVKLRGVHFRGGYHDFNIAPGGLIVFPRLVAAEHHNGSRREQVGSGVAEIDALLKGGFDFGTSALIMGPAGVGKSALASQYVAEHARRGGTAAVFIFDESVQILLARSKGLGIDLASHVESGRVRLRQIDPAEMSPGELVHLVREVVETHGTRMVVIDSLNGYLHSMPEEQFLVVQLHELLSYLGQRGVATLLLLAQHGFLGEQVQAPVDVSYLVDTVMLLRYFETQGEVRQALSVMKRRSGGHERTVRELRLTPRGLVVGEALREFVGVLSGTPQYVGQRSGLVGGEGVSGGK